MATKDLKKPNDPVDIGPGYETRDAHIPALLQFAFWMAMVLVVTLIGMRFTFDYFKKAEPLGPMASPMLQQTYRMLPPSPRLQVLPHQELMTYCAAQQSEVTTYGWVNQQSGVVRIPVDRAMDLIMERGLPSRAAGEIPAMDPSMVPMPTAVVPTVSGGADVEGQCGYLTEPSPDMAPTEDSATK